MSVTEQLSTAALALLVVAATMTGTVALSGGVAAQTDTPQPYSGEVELQDPIPEDSTEFEVRITELNTDDESGCLDVEKNGEFRTGYDDVSEGDSITVDAESVGGLQAGDDISVQLLRSSCERRLDTDRTTVNEAGFFIDINSTNSPVDEGETLEVEARIENTGAQIDSQDIVMTVAGSEEDRKTVGLDGQAAINKTFTWETEPGDAGDYTVALSSEDDEAITDAQVEEQAEFAVTINSTNSPVAVGETLEVTAIVENTDDFEDTQEVVLNIDGNRTDSTNLTLDGGESETVTLEWPTGDSDLGNHTAEVASETDANETNVRVQQPAAFAVTIDSTNSPVAEGEDLNANVTVENVGDLPGNKTVTLSVGAVERDSTDVRLDPGESRAVTLTWETGDGDAGNYTAEAAAGNGSDSAAVTVTSAPTPTPTPTGGDGDGGDGDGNATFEVTITEVRPPDGSGGSLEVDATVENTGDRSDTQNVSLTVDGEETDSRELTLDGGESESVTFSSPSAPEDTERLGVRVASQDDADESTVEFDETDPDDGLFPGNSGGILLLLLLLLLLLAYYYFRRRRYQSNRVPVSGDDGNGVGDGDHTTAPGDDGEGGGGNGDGDDNG